MSLTCHPQREVWPEEPGPKFKADFLVWYTDESTIDDQAGAGIDNDTRKMKISQIMVKFSTSIPGRETHAVVICMHALSKISKTKQ